MLSKFLCRIGWHDWKLSKGVGYSRFPGHRMVILYDRDCRRCGKHAEGAMSI